MGQNKLQISIQSEDAYKITLKFENDADQWVVSGKILQYIKGKGI